jgi:hypothetical protein
VLKELVRLKPATRKWTADAILNCLRKDFSLGAATLQKKILKK